MTVIFYEKQNLVGFSLADVNLINNHPNDILDLPQIALGCSLLILNYWPRCCYHYYHVVTFR